MNSSNFVNCYKRILMITYWIQARFEKLKFLFIPYIKYFQLHVNLFLYHHKTIYTYFLRSSSKTLNTLYLTSVEYSKQTDCIEGKTRNIHQLIN